MADPAPLVPDASLEGVDYRALQDAILTAFANERVGEKLPDQIAVLPSVHSWSNPDLLVNAVGQASLIIEKPFPETVWWVEYDPDYAQLIFVLVTGQIMGFGLPVHPSVDVHLRRANTMFIVQIDDNGKVLNVDERRVAVRKNGVK